MGCVNQDKECDLRCEQTWEISRESGIIQLKKLVPLEILYSNHHNSGVVGSTWMDHHQKFSEYVLKNKPNNDPLGVEDDIKILILMSSSTPNGSLLGLFSADKALSY